MGDVTSICGRDVRTAAGAVAFVLLALGFMLDWGSVTGQLRVFWSIIPAVDIAVAAVAAAIARRPSLSRPERRLWYALALVATVMMVGDTGQAVVVWTAPSPAITPSALTDLCNLIGTALMLIMLLCYPTTAGSWSERLRYLLDAATVAVGTGVTMWFLLEPSGTDAGGDPFRLLGAAVLAMSGFAVTKLTLTGALAIRAPATVLMAGGSLLQGYFYGLLVPGSATNLALAGLTLAAGMVCVGARIHHRDRPRLPATTRPHRRYSLMPYASVFLQFVLMPFVVRNGVDADFWVVLSGLFTVTGLVVARQVLALRENAALLIRLDASLLESRHLQERLRHEATHDALTGLANRALFDERLHSTTSVTTVLLVDLDGFKAINDTYGHHAGDAILVDVANRLRRCVPVEATAARLGGDEFAVLLPGTDVDSAQRVVDRFTALLDEPVSVDAVLLYPRASLGMATGETAAPNVLRQADEAMYRNKRRTLNHVDRPAELV